MTNPSESYKWTRMPYNVLQNQLLEHILKLFIDIYYLTEFIEIPNNVKCTRLFSIIILFHAIY